MTDSSVEPCSMLFVPADAERFLAKAGRRGADALILDLEDAVARPAKAAARANLASFIRRLKQDTRIPIHVRVNNEPELLAGDLQAAVAAGCDGLLVPKVDTPAQVLQLDADLHELERKDGRKPGSIRVAALIESPLGICNVLAIAQS